MNTINISTRRGHDGLIVFIAVVLVMSLVSPLAMHFVRRDSGVFLYAGWRILNGEAPYRDFWDNKPPMIFYLNAAGLGIAGGSRWGVWVMELFSLVCASLIGFKMLKEVFGRRSAFLTTILWLLALIGILSGGNYTTEYTLPIQFACLWLAYQSEKKGVYSWRGYWIGALCCLAFFTKQNTIGICIAILLHILVTKLRPVIWKKTLTDMAFIIFGGVSASAAIIVLLASQGVLKQFWDAAFIYNYIYSSTGIFEHLASAVMGMLYLSTLTLLAWMGWGMKLLGRKFEKKLNQHKLDLGEPSLLSICLLAMPIEVILASFSGYSYRHYYMPLLPSYAIFTGYSFSVFYQQLSSPQITRMIKRLLLVSNLLIFLIPVITAGIAWVKDMHYVTNRGFDYSAVTDYIERKSSSDETLLLWGAEVEINFVTHRRSPSRFIFLDPLYKSGYVNEGMIVGFLDDVIQEKPHLIIDAAYPTTPFFIFNVTSPRIEEMLGVLRASYLPAEKFGDWVVYEYKGN